MLRSACLPVPLFLLLSFAAQAKDPAADAVVATVQRLFDAMAAHDAAAIRSVLTADGFMYAVRDRQTTASSHADFAARISNSKDQFLERMKNPKVRVSGRIASLWAPYEFLRNGELSHCGVDTATLIQEQDGSWKIASLHFTVIEKSRCK